MPGYFNVFVYPAELIHESMERSDIFEVCRGIIPKPFFKDIIILIFLSRIIEDTFGYTFADHLADQRGISNDRGVAPCFIRIPNAVKRFVGFPAAEIPTDPREYRKDDQRNPRPDIQLPADHRVNNIEYAP